MIIEDSSNRFFRSTRSADHAWKGTPSSGQGSVVPKTKYGEPVRPYLVRKAATRVVEA